MAAKKKKVLRSGGRRTTDHSAYTPARTEAEKTETEQNVSQTQAEIIQVCEEIRDLLIEKNRAYGDSALKPMRVFSRADNVEQIKVRLDDKIKRLCHGHALPDESLEQTTDDMMGYLVLLKIAVRRRANAALGARL